LCGEGGEDKEERGSMGSSACVGAALEDRGDRGGEGEGEEERYSSSPPPSTLCRWSILSLLATLSPIFSFVAPPFPSPSPHTQLGRNEYLFPILSFVPLPPPSPSPRVQPVYTPFMLLGRVGLVLLLLRVVTCSFSFTSPILSRSALPLPSPSPHTHPLNV
jgi:hypothetical protein